MKGRRASAAPMWGRLGWSLGEQGKFTACAAPRRAVSEVRGAPPRGLEAACASSPSGRNSSQLDENPTRSRLGHMPGTVQEAIAVGIAGGRVFLEGVERLALVGPHLLAVVPN